ncbi:pyridoxamine 5'-phosphate oxidase family protein [Streptomyces sp. NBC_00536]|uniref:pyridoxamine 5'-phosphate oxidase family protein n=1 Tax=Streptomyces sp. NBC_00536 TaxID=2975769 RepID=UPI002E81FB4C|nr:pyridoxamine 5'-phosphate oxidase family protein [Streptomyces sp. NBC_00536]WUC79052.1 pyridoxamine 5'-phosphate oxidase family protein [Streptomyces sp. NBC_00536]
MTYRRGSLAVQRQVGVREAAEHVGRSVGSGIREVAAAFLAQQPFLVVGAADEGGRLWASQLTGPPGFVRATGSHRITVTGAPGEGDPLAGVLATPGTAVGTIALDPRTRRRMRLNGVVDRGAEGAAGFSIEAEQVFSNCPKYLQKRHPLALEPEGGGVERRGGVLDPDQEGFVRSADTFFVATTAEGGVEASHRGGFPGFVEVHSPYELSWPDYPGNAMFLTLGNLVSDPRAGLLFPHWESGALLQLSGRARTEYGADGGRTVRFTVDAVVESRHPGRLRWSGPEYSPANPPLAPAPGGDHRGSTTR